MNTESFSAKDMARPLLRCLLLLNRHLRSARTGKQLPAAPLQVLGLLSQRRRATATDLAVALGIKKQSLTLLLTMLHGKGYLDRARDPGDARKIFLFLTASGRDAFLREMDGRRERLARLVAERLTDEEAASLQKILPVLEKLALEEDDAPSENGPEG